MPKESLEGCPRCDDYDKIKDELESKKRHSQDEQKNALKRCEQGKAKLQKKLLTIGAIAIVAGTILGKDFVDMVADYINSFNDVKNAASKLVGMADTPPTTPETNTTEDTHNDTEDTQESTPSLVDTTYWAGVPDMNLFSSSSSIPYAMLMGDFESSLIDMVTSEMLTDNLAFTHWAITDSLSDRLDLTVFGSTAWEPLDLSPWDFPNESYGMMYEPPSAIVPESGAWIPLMGMPILLSKRRRRP
jgi:hypothetical protein